MYSVNVVAAMNTATERLSAEVTRLRAAIAAIKQAAIEGRVCDDVAWFDTITTLHDYCDQILNQPEAGGDEAVTIRDNRVY